jgi:hypothetical protein
MAFTPQNFKDNVGPVLAASWLNALDVTANFVLNGAQTVAQAQTALGIPSGGIAVPVVIGVGGTGQTTAAAALNALGGTTAAAALAAAEAAINQAYIGSQLYPRTPDEVRLGITPINFAYVPGSFYRYNAKGGAVRVADAVITAGSAVVTSASGGFAKAVAGMVFVIVDGAASRTGGRPAPLITTILSVQSANQITMNATATQPGTVTMNGTLTNTSKNVASTSVNPITSGVGLTRIWNVTGTNIVGGTTVSQTSSSTLTLSIAATGNGVSALTLTATIEACFGYDDSTAILAALSLPYPINDVADAFLMTQPIPWNGAGCNDLNMPSALIIMALGNNASHCFSASGFDRQVPGPYPQYLATGLRYLPFKIDIGEIECCNSGLDGFSLGPSTWSRVRMRVTNPFRNALGEFFLAGGWQESNTVEINCGQVGLHFHHKVNKSSAYQNLGSYVIQGRGCGLNSGYLGINVATQPDQCGGAIRLYCGNVGTGISQNVWGGSLYCEMDAERSTALSFGSDVCNSPVTFVDATATYVIEGAGAASSNLYVSNTFGNLVIEDITQSADTRGGYQFYAMTNAVVQNCTVLSVSAGPWGQVYANPLMLNGIGNFVRSLNMSYAGYIQLMLQGSAVQNTLNLINGGAGSTPALSIGGQIGLSGNTPPAQSTGWGTPTGASVSNNFNGAAATLAQTSAAVAELITLLKAQGLLAT